MTRKPISPADSTPVRVVLVTLDNHIVAAVDAARLALTRELPGLTLTVHAATDWAENAGLLAACRSDILAGDIIIVSMIFVEEHVKAIADVLEARHRECDAMVCCMSAGMIMKYTSMGRFRMSGEQKGPLALLKKLRGSSSRGGKDSGKTAGERQLAMLRRLPQLLRFIPGTAQDVRNYFLTLQYRIAASEENVANMVRLLVAKYAQGDRKGLQTKVTVGDPVEYPDVGLYHPRLKPRVTTQLSALPQPAAPRAASGPAPQAAATPRPMPAQGQTTTRPAAVTAKPAPKRSGLRAGMTIVHPKYGRGTVLRKEGDGEDAKLTVSFPGHGLKKLIAKFAGLAADD